MFSLIKHAQTIKPILSFRIAASFQTSALDQAKKVQIEEKLGLPPRPKKPLSPFFRFLKEFRPQIAKENPDLKSPQLIKVLAQKYKDEMNDASLERYTNEYTKEQQDYAKRVYEYQNKLTMEQKLRLADAKTDKVDRKERMAYKKKLRDNNKPKRPITGFIRFIVEQHNKSPRDQSKQTYREWQKTVAGKWVELTEAERKVYSESASAELIKYKEDLLNWENKMIRLGNTDIIRIRTGIENDEKPAIKRRKTKKSAPSSSDSD